jgi:hypothetical protein
MVTATWVEPTSWFEHRDGYCFGHLEGRDAELVYGAPVAEVIQYGHWSWRSWSLRMIAVEVE